mmetsp:Transcript_42056/g.69285  ORF Transcript_42056/g.69285 Transcript_42056/m.69285 type:complete len:202 (-) Transcript_42056:37-642(-)
MQRIHDFPVFIEFEPIWIDGNASLLLRSIKLKIIIAASFTQFGWIDFLQRTAMHGTDPRTRTIVARNRVSQMCVETTIVECHLMRLMRRVIANEQMVQIHAVTRPTIQILSGVNPLMLVLAQVQGKLVVAQSIQQLLRHELVAFVFDGDFIALLIKRNDHCNVTSAVHLCQQHFGAWFTHVFIVFVGQTTKQRKHDLFLLK